MQGSAHPRSRGENPLTVAVMVAMPGSSPLTRGKPVDGGGHGGDAGLIPAHAGKTCRTFSTCSSLPAHPRSRGENSPSALPMMREAGSSPLTRGKQQRLDRGSVAPRLIPAHAGKTTRAVTRLRALSAHPRSRGENISTVTGGIQSAGSSPLTRGKRSMPRPHVGSRRLIPAHAGKTSFRCGSPGR